MIISRAPLRLSFFGGGTDFPEYFSRHGGAVLAAAIDKFSYVTASPFRSELFEYAVRVSYSRGELVRTVEDIQHPVFRACLKYCGLEKDIELHAVADLPAFTGLGSSSTFTVSLLHALHAYIGREISPGELAQAAIHIEREALGEAIGVQDQTVAAMGGFHVFEFSGQSSITATPMDLGTERLAELEGCLFLVFTGIKRRAAEIEKRKLDRLKDNLRLLHRMRQMVDEAHQLLTGTGSLASLGELMDESWKLKKGLENSVSTPEIDALYEKAKSAGAWGGKLAGAGGGGFLLLLAPPECHQRLGAVLEPLPRIPIRIGAPGSTIIFRST